MCGRERVSPGPSFVWCMRFPWNFFQTVPRPSEFPWMFATIPEFRDCHSLIKQLWESILPRFPWVFLDIGTLPSRSPRDLPPSLDGVLDSFSRDPLISEGDGTLDSHVQ